MKYPYIKLISDVHEEFKIAGGNSPQSKFFRLELPRRETDKDTILVVAGDLNSRHPSAKYKPLADTLIKWSAQFKHVIFVFGNHEYWHSNWEYSVEEVKTLVEDVENIHILDEDDVILDGINFLGVTLWGDFAKDPLTEWDINRRWSDVQMIRQGRDYRRIRAMDVSYTHLAHIKYIDQMLDFFKMVNDFPNVVVTHHLPHFNSIAERFKTSNVNMCYYSDQSEILEKHDIALWCHGHTHDSCNYEIFGTRIMCNPHGYFMEKNPEFDPELLIDLEKIWSPK